MVGTASGNDTVQLVASHSEEDLQHNGVDESIEEAITADAPPDQQKEGATGAATAEDQQKERTPIVWVGRSKEPSATTSSAAAEAPATANDSTAERPLLRLKPNAGFLLNLVVDAERGNKRKCAEEATQVSLNVLGQAVAAGVRPQLARVGPDASDAAVRRVVLSVAQQQKLATCSALLREVAASYGFALHIAPDVGDEDLEEAEDGEETTASGDEVGDRSGTGTLTNGHSAAKRQRQGFQDLQSLGVRLNLASHRGKAKPESAGPASGDDADTAPRPPKPRAPGINMAANRLAGAALGAIGVAVPDKAHPLARPSHSQALQSLSAKIEGRTAVLGRDEEDEAMSEADLEDLEDLDEGDVKFPGRSADVDSAGHSADDQQHPTSRAQGNEPENTFSSGVMRQLGLVAGPTQAGSKQQAAAKGTLESPAPQVNGSKLSRGSLRMDSPGIGEPDEELEDSEEGQPPPDKSQRRGILRMDAHELDEPEEDLEGSYDGQAAAGNGQRKSRTPCLRMDSMTRKISQSGTLASRAWVTDASRQMKQTAAVQPAVDMGRLLSRASAAATVAQQRRETNERASADAAAGSSADDVDDPDMPTAARRGVTRNGADPLQSGKRTAQGVLGDAARQLKRARKEDDMSGGRERWEQREQDGDERSERTGEGQKERMNVKGGGRAGRGLFGAAMAGLNGRCPQ